MGSQSVSRAVISAGLWFAVAYGGGMALGSMPNLVDCAVDAGILGAASMGSDLVHSVVGWNPSGVSSAAATGALYAAAEKLYRNDDNYLVNAAVAGANDWAVEMYLEKSSAAAMYDQMASAEADSE